MFMKGVFQKHFGQQLFERGRDLINRIWKGIPSLLSSLERGLRDKRNVAVLSGAVNTKHKSFPLLSVFLKALT